MKILIADDHALFRDSLRSLLDARGFEVVGEARKGREAVELARRLQPDVVLMDLSMPELDGLAATRLISAEHARGEGGVLTASDEDAQLFEAIKSGAQGYLLKNLESRGALRPPRGGRPRRARPDAAAGRQAPPGVRPPAPARPSSPRPRRPDRPRAGGAGAAGRRHHLEPQAGQALGVSENTVKFHVRNILDKLHLHNRAQVVGFALRHGIVARGRRHEAAVMAQACWPVMAPIIRGAGRRSARAKKRTKSDSVRIPTTREPSTTGRQPYLFWNMIRAASASDWPASAVSTSEVITSSTWMRCITVHCWLRELRALDQRVAQQVAVGEQADQVAVPVDHDQMAEPVVEHQLVGRGDASRRDGR